MKPIRRRNSTGVSGSSNSEDTRKEQIHLTPGSPEYMEYVRDHSGVDEHDYIADDAHYEDGDDRRPDEDQVSKPVSEEVAEHASKLRVKNDSAFRQGGKIGYRKYRSQILKEGENDTLQGEALFLAKHSSKTKCAEIANIKLAHRITQDKKVEEYAKDVTVEPDEYLPLAMSRYEDLMD